MAKRLVSIRLSEAGRSLLEAIAEKRGVTQAAVIELALAALARQEEEFTVTQCEACKVTVPVQHTRYKRIEVSLPDRGDGIGQKIIRSGSVCEDCLQPERWEEIQAKVRRQTLLRYQAGGIAFPLD